jgi:hypothetical protein
MKPPPAHTLVNRIILLMLTLLVFSGTLGLGAVWMRQEISQAANQSRALHVKIADVERRLDEVHAQVAAAVNPDTLLRQNQTMRLALAAPRETQVVRVGESAELRLAAKRNREVFSVGTASFEPATPRGVEFKFVSAALR